MTLASIGTLPVMIICFILVPKIVQKFGKRNVILVMSTYNLLLSTYILLFPIQSALLLHDFKPVSYDRTDRFYHFDLGSGYRLSGLQRMENEFPRRRKHVQPLYVQP